MNVQTVSFTDADAPARFTESLRNTGFGVLTNHPIPWDLVAGVFADWERFFASPEKTRYTFDPKRQWGYFPFKSENAKGSNVKDLKEFYQYYTRGGLPDDFPKRSVELFGRLSELGATLLSWIEQHTPADVRAGLSMSLPQMIANSGDTMMRPIHYPPLSGGEEVGAIRAAAHEDINLITLLPSASAPGLEVLDAAGRWHEVPCDPGSIVINNGDMLQMATRGLYRSTTHRVVNPPSAARGTSRYSIPLFLHPRPEVRLSPDHTAGSYLRERLLEIGLISEQPKPA